MDDLGGAEPTPNAVPCLATHPPWRGARPAPLTPRNATLGPPTQRTAPSRTDFCYDDAARQRCNLRYILVHAVENGNIIDAERRLLRRGEAGRGRSVVGRVVVGIRDALDQFHGPQLNAAVLYSSKCPHQTQ